MLIRTCCCLFELCGLDYIFSDIDVQVSFPTITVGESEGEARVCVMITDGVLAIDVSVQLTTASGTATGILYHHQIFTV